MKGYIELSLDSLQMIKIENILGEIDEYREKYTEGYPEYAPIETPKKFLGIIPYISTDYIEEVEPYTPNGLYWFCWCGHCRIGMKDWVEDLRKIYKLFMNGRCTECGYDDAGLEVNVSIAYKALVDQDVVDLLDNLGIVGSDL